MRNILIQLKEGDKDRSRVWEFVGQLKDEGGEDEVEIATVFEVTGTEERRSKLFVSRHPFADCLGDCRLASPGEPVQTEDRRPAEVFGP